MSHWNPKSLWDEFIKTLTGTDEERRDRSVDPSLLFHMMFTAPLLLGLLLMVKRA